MAMSGGQKGPFADINVTPLVDVMLVLLVIFMITAPLLLNGISLDLPRTAEVNPLQLSHDQIVLSYSRDKELFLGEQKVLQSEIEALIKQQFQEKNTSTLFLRAHGDLPYKDVAFLMSFLKSKGILQLALVTELEEK